ncbi:uncharacterized protein LOC117117618 isoform X1 [Anneissia japonica]|uniref:uncharacterized protein LOC117117618 isoform X1 n=1 Tax=Anneissia japonica TaxID=1529436 RepID=UPI001425B696|nr:uncharacterized protein LOC117117618 isoform X1 [Anneissia japonica]
MSLCSMCFKGRDSDPDPTQELKTVAGDVPERRDFIHEVEKAMSLNKKGMLGCLSSGSDQTTRGGDEQNLNCSDIFILHCNNMEDKALAKELSDKFRSIESHLYVVQQSDYKALRTRPRITQGAINFCSRLIVVLSDKYIQEDYGLLRKMLTHSGNQQIKQKLIVVRRVEKKNVPNELREDVYQTVEYNVETDSKFFWYNKSFFQRAVPPSSQILFYTN